jgi:hypothetical protein
MRPKKVKFQTTHPQFDVPKPIPASKAMPDWYRKMAGVENQQMTIKKCVPFLDAMTSGYVISLAADVEFTGEGVTNTSKIPVVTSHHPEQTKDLHVPPEYLSIAHKWENLFVMSTPKGYSTLFVHPLNRTDLPFMSISGVVDTDKHPVPVNFPFFIRKDFVGLIPAGTPIIQAIPFKRTSWESEVDEVNFPKEVPGLHQMHNPPFGYYKKHWWSRKTYS